jgi:Tfp pilus assembly protein PilF
MTAEAAQKRLIASRSLFDAGNFAGAERLLGEALAEDPESAAAHALLSLTLYRQGKGRPALDAAKAAVALDPNANGLRTMTLAQMLLGRTKDAIETARAACAADPEDELANLVLAMAYERAGKSRDAEAAYRRTVDMVPSNPGVRADFGRFLVRRKKLTEAEAQLAAIDPSCDRESTLLLRGEIALRRGRTEEARDFALWVLAQDATNQSALRLLTQVKASRSVLLGVWWRYSMFVATRPRWLRLLVMIPFFCALLVIGHGLALLLFVYLALSSVAFARMVRQEVKTVALKKGF